MFATDAARAFCARSWAGHRSDIPVRSPLLRSLWSREHAMLAMHVWGAALLIDPHRPFHACSETRVVHSFSCRSHEDFREECEPPDCPITFGTRGMLLGSKGHVQSLVRRNRKSCLGLDALHAPAASCSLVLHPQASLSFHVVDGARDQHHWAARPSSNHVTAAALASSLTKHADCRERRHGHRLEHSNAFDVSCLPDVNTCLPSSLLIIDITPSPRIIVFADSIHASRRASKNGEERCSQKRSRH
jgi:hypothetical protein